jgi:hypothetical protein
MAKKWQEIAKAITKEYESILTVPPDAILKVFKYDMIDSGAGSYNTTLNAQVYCAGDVRYLAFYGTTNIVYLAGDPAFELEHLVSMYKQFVPISAEFIGYCGLVSIYKWNLEIMEVIDTLKTKQDFIDLVCPYIQLAATYNLWIQHYFQWNAGANRRQVSAKDAAEIARLASLPKNVKSLRA